MSEFANILPPRTAQAWKNVETASDTALPTQISLCAAHIEWVVNKNKEFFRDFLKGKTSELYSQGEEVAQAVAEQEDDRGEDDRTDVAFLASVCLGTLVALSIAVAVRRRAPLGAGRETLL